MMFRAGNRHVSKKAVLSVDLVVFVSVCVALAVVKAAVAAFTVAAAIIWVGGGWEGGAG